LNKYKKPAYPKLIIEECEEKPKHKKYKKKSRLSSLEVKRQKLLINLNSSFVEKSKIDESLKMKDISRILTPIAKSKAYIKGFKNNSYLSPTRDDCFEKLYNGFTITTNKSKFSPSKNSDE
jgi:hypothetical protein